MKPKPQPKPRLATADLAIILGLIVATFLVYAQVGGFDFTSYDDNLYVTENPQVQAGLTLHGIAWAWTAVVASNWMPVTLLSHMLDCELFHLQSGMHHLINVLFHVIGSLLLFAVMKRATRARGASAFTAFVFALHPLHVESVAWVGERKDVLSACFWFLALYAYVRYSEQPALARYLLVAGFFLLGLMAKPMLVTFPFVLILFDVWPLRRMNLRFLWEKLPLVGLSAAISVVTFHVQSSTEAVQAFPLSVRMGNALISYVVYIGQTFWPSGLAIIYPYQMSPPWWQAAASLVLLVVISVFAVRAWRTRPYLAVGWFWYLGTLVPVIGLVQVGLQSHADRYMYIPMVGLLIMLAWGMADLIVAWPRTKLPIRAAGALSCVACMVTAWGQIEYWQNSGTLFERAIAVTRDNYVAEYNLANYLANTHRSAEAIPHYQAALLARPNYPEAENNFGMVLGRMPGRMPDAMSHFQAAVRLRPDLLQAQYNLAVALVQLGRIPDAIQHYEIVQRMQPSPEIAKTIEDLRARLK